MPEGTFLCFKASQNFRESHESLFDSAALDFASQIPKKDEHTMGHRLLVTSYCFPLAAIQMLRILQKWPNMCSATIPANPYYLPFNQVLFIKERGIVPQIIHIIVNTISWKGCTIAVVRKNHPH